jgi:hypothetical protein
MDSTIVDIRSLPSINDLGLCEQNVISVSCQRSVKGNQFSAGDQSFNFSISGSQRWSPSRSYFKARLKVTTDAVGATAPTQADRLALAEGFMNNMYNNAYCYIGNTDVSSLSQYIGQMGAVKTRLSKTKGWQDSVGKSCYGLNPNFEQRIQDVSSDGAKTPGERYNITSAKLGFDVQNTVALTASTQVASFASGGGPAVPDVRTIFNIGDVITINALTFVITGITGATTIKLAGILADLAATTAFSISRASKSYSNLARHHEIEVCFQPPIGIFSSESALPAGQYRLSLMPKNTSGIEALQSDLGTTGTVTVDEIFFQMAVFKDDKAFDSGTYYLSLDEMNVQPRTLQSGGGQTSLNFTVPSSTFGLAVFTQGVEAGTTTRLPPSKFHCVGSDASALGLKSFQITYSNVSKPQQNISSTFLNTQQYLTGRYNETFINADLYNLSCESLSDWVTRGPLLYYSWVKSSEDRSTELQLSMLYEAMEANSNVFVCSFYRNLLKITVDMGYITDVQKIAM